MVNLTVAKMMPISNQTRLDLVLCMKYVGRVFQQSPGNFELLGECKYLNINRTCNFEK